MKKRWMWSGLSAVVLLGVVGGLFVFQTPPPNPTDPLAVARAQHGYPSSPEALRQADIEDRIARRAQGYAKPNNPDLFFQYHQEIRTRLDDPTQQYAPNYRLQALRAAQQVRKSSSKQLNWQERGPGNVSGRTRGLVVDVRDSAGNTWYAGSVGGGIWKTENAGQSWRNLTPDLPNLATVSLAQCTVQPQVFYAGTGEGFFNADAIRGDGIWKSTDGGETWTQLASTANSPNFRTVNRLIVDPSNPSTVVAATNAGLLRTTDGGETWQTVYASPNPVQQVIATPNDFRIQYAAEYKGGVLKSEDSGQNWRQVFRWSDYYSSKSIEGRMELAVAPSQPVKVFFVVDHVVSSDFWLSNDRGETWRILPEDDGDAPDWLSGQGWYDNTIAVHPFDSRTVFVGGINLWQIRVARSDDKRTTTEITNWFEGRPNPDHPSGFFPFVHADHHGLFTVPFDEDTESFRLINTNDGGVEYSDDGGITWSKTLTGYNTSQFYGADKQPGANAFIGGMQDNGTWRSPEGANAAATTPWLNQLGGDGFSTVWHAEDPARLMGSIQFNDFWRTLDGGATWEQATEGLPNTGFFISTLAKSQSDPELLLTTSPVGIWRSDTFGARWSPATLDSSGRWYPFGNRAPAALSIADPQVMWAGARMTNTHSLFVSQDGGLTFTPTSQAPNVSASISGLATHPTDPQTAYALFSAANAPKIIRTTDLGNTWENLTGTVDTGAALSSNGFPNVATYALLVMPFNPNVLWAGTEIGLFVSEDGGGTWQYANNGLPAVSIWQLSIVDDQVVAATHGRGVWSVSLPELTNYLPPSVVRSPRFNDLFFTPASALGLDVDVRSDYDSLDVWLDEVLLARLTTPYDTVFSLPLLVEAPSTRTAQLVAYRNGQTYQSAQESVNVFPVAAPQVRFESSFEDESDDFFGDGFEEERYGDFANRAVHTRHPYRSRQEITYLLRVPIKVAAREAVLSYRDIAIIEPGEPGTTFGDQEFWDYVVVEGSTNSVVWKPLAPGYDADFDTRWRTVYDEDRPPDASLFVEHTINLHDTFNPGDVIFLRFRLFADAAVSGWGWVIDDLRIQPDATVATETTVPSEALALLPSYPNPFVEEATLPYRVPTTGPVQLAIFDLQGRRVRTLVDTIMPAGAHTVPWDGRTDAGTAVASGVYFARLRTEAGTRTQQLVRVR